MTVVVASDSGSGTFSPKDPGSSQYYYWDFTAWLQPTESVQSAIVTATNNADQSDNTPAMVTEAAVVLNNVVVRQKISAGVNGDIYRMTAGASTLDSVTGLMQVLYLSALLPVQPVFGVME